MSLEEIKCIKVNGVVMLMSLMLFGRGSFPGVLARAVWMFSNVKQKILRAWRGDMYMGRALFSRFICRRNQPNPAMRFLDDFLATRIFCSLKLARYY